MCSARDASLATGVDYDDAARIQRIITQRGPFQDGLVGCPFNEDDRVCEQRLGQPLEEHSRQLLHYLLRRLDTVQPLDDGPQGGAVYPRSVSLTSRDRLTSNAANFREALGLEEKRTVRCVRNLNAL